MNELRVKPLIKLNNLDKLIDDNNLLHCSPDIKTNHIEP